MDWVIKLENVTVKDRDKTIIENITLEVERGEWVGVIGPNGAG
ncbi:ABC transporter ATP-binding protein, partial [bacterium]